MKIQSSKLFFQKKKMNTISKVRGIQFHYIHSKKKHGLPPQWWTSPSRYNLKSQTSILQLRQTGQWIHSRSTMGTPGGVPIPGLEKRNPLGCKISIPYYPSMEYLTTFGWLLMVNLGKYTIHGRYGHGKLTFQDGSLPNSHHEDDITCLVVNPAIQLHLPLLLDGV